VNDVYVLERIEPFFVVMQSLDWSGTLVKMYGNTTEIDNLL